MVTNERDGMKEVRASHESAFVEFRRKVRNSELLTLAVSQLLQEMSFTGRLSVVVQNGSVLKSGYEEGYFTRKDQQRLT
jgi:sulfur carrier protein ThiS